MLVCSSALAVIIWSHASISCMHAQAHINDLIPLLHVAPSLELDLLCNLRYHLADASESRPQQSFWCASARLLHDLT